MRSYVKNQSWEFDLSIFDLSIFDLSIFDLSIFDLSIFDLSTFSIFKKIDLFHDHIDLSIIKTIESIEKPMLKFPTHKNRVIRWVSQADSELTRVCMLLSPLLSVSLYAYKFRL